jgi:hypothetical protein
MAGPSTSTCSSPRLMSGVELVVIEDTETGEIYEVGLDDFLTYGTVIDHGAGVQVALPLKYWLRSSMPQLRLGF